MRHNMEVRNPPGLASGGSQRSHASFYLKLFGKSKFPSPYWLAPLRHLRTGDGCSAGLHPICYTLFTKNKQHCGMLASKHSMLTIRGRLSHLLSFSFHEPGRKTTATLSQQDRTLGERKRFQIFQNKNSMHALLPTAHPASRTRSEAIRKLHSCSEGNKISWSNL